MVRKLPTYETRIVADPDIMVGKPVVKGTRIPVEVVLAHLADNPDPNDLFEAYPRLTLEDLKACLAFAEEQVKKTFKPKHGGQAPPIHPPAL
jgi:uncharacterized protein (DUF433 family)